MPRFRLLKTKYSGVITMLQTPANNTKDDDKMSKELARDYRGGSDNEDDDFVDGDV